MDTFPVDLLNIVYEFIPRVTDNDMLLERIHSVLCFDTTGWLCDHSFEICRIRTDTDVHLVFLDVCSDFARLCVTDLAYIRIPGDLLQHPDKLTTARFLLSLFYNATSERLINPREMYPVVDDIPVVKTEAGFVTHTGFIQIWHTQYLPPRTTSISPPSTHPAHPHPGLLLSPCVPFFGNSALSPAPLLPFFCNL